MSERTAKVLLASVILARCFQPHGHPFPYGIFDNAADFQ